MLTTNEHQTAAAALMAPHALRQAAQQHGLSGPQLRALLALWTLSSSNYGSVTPGQLAGTGLMSPTLLRAYVRVLALAGFVERYRDHAGQLCLSPTAKGNTVAREASRALHVAGRAFLRE